MFMVRSYFCLPFSLKLKTFLKHLGSSIEVAEAGFFFHRLFNSIFFLTVVGSLLKLLANYSASFSVLHILNKGL